MRRLAQDRNPEIAAPDSGFVLRTARMTTKLQAGHTTMRFMMLMIPLGYETAAGRQTRSERVGSDDEIQSGAERRRRADHARRLHPPSMGHGFVRERQASGNDGHSPRQGSARRLLDDRCEITGEAIAWAKRCPAASNEVIEIRQVQEMVGFPRDVRRRRPDLPNCRAARTLTDVNVCAGAWSRDSGRTPVELALVTFAAGSCKSFHMSWRKEQRRAERGYHHGN